MLTHEIAYIVSVSCVFCFNLFNAAIMTLMSLTGIIHDPKCEPKVAPIVGARHALINI